MTQFCVCSNSKRKENRNFKFNIINILLYNIPTKYVILLFKYYDLEKKPNSQRISN